MSIINIGYFNIQKDTIPLIIEDLSNTFSEKRKRQIEKQFKSVYDFVAIIYYFRFIEKLQISEIAHKLEMQVQPLYIHLYNLGWQYSNDFEENSKQFEIERKKLNDEYIEAKINSSNISLNEHEKLKYAINHKSNMRKEVYINLGFASAVEYVRTVYYLVYISRLTTVQLVILFNLPYPTVQLRLRNLGFNLTLDEAMKKKKEKSRQNYERTFRAGKITRLKDRMNNLSDGSKNENYARELIDKLVYEYFDSNIYDIVVGVNNVGLLSSKEIDIPVIIHNRLLDRFFKFAVEYNGEIYHDDDSDKISIAQNRGWLYLAIKEGLNGRESNNPKIIETKVRQLCVEMRDIIKNLERE
ncbi:hypothetical protein M1D70_04970 [Paenibacillus sp. AK002]